MLRCILALAIAISLGSVSFAKPSDACTNCRKPVRNAISAVPTLAPRASTHTARPVKAKAVERSVVVRRGHVRGPGLFARIRFAPQSRWR